MKTKRLIGLLAFSLVLPACDDGDDTGDDASMDSGAATEDGDDDDDDDDDDAEDADSGGSDDGDSNLCDPNDMHGTICECTAGEQEECEEGGVRFCFWVDFDVSADQVWGPCGECVPGQTEACDEEGLVRTCDAVDTYDTSLPEDPPAFGECMPAE